MNDLNKEAYKEMVPLALEQTIKDVLMFRNLKEQIMSSAEMKSLTHERISGDIVNQIIRMDIHAVDAGKPSAAEPSGQQAAEWAMTLGYGPTQGAVGKNGAGKGWNGSGGKDQKGKGFGNEKGKSGGQ